MKKCNGCNATKGLKSCWVDDCLSGEPRGSCVCKNCFFDNEYENDSDVTKENWDQYNYHWNLKKTFKTRIKSLRNQHTMKQQMTVQPKVNERSTCIIFDELWEKYYKFKEQVNANPEPCCIDECCEGFDDCGEDCCNEDGNKPMGICWCKEESQGYEPCSDELLKNLKDADKKLMEHRDESGCVICTENLKRKI